MLLLAMAAGVAVLVLAACGGDDDDAAAPTDAVESVQPVEEAPSDFETALKAASERTELAVDEAVAALLDPNVDGPQPGLLAETLPALSAAIVAYAAEVEALAAPEEFRADQARHVSGLKEIAANIDAAAAADAARDQEQLDALGRDAVSLERNLIADLSTEYAALAFVSTNPFATDQLVDLSPEETEYFDEIAAAQAEFARRSSAFGAALGRSYTSTEALLNALYEAGAGEAMAAVQEVAVTIEPPPRFAADHELFLAALEEQVRIDRLIGEAARDGDIVKFELNNHRLSLVAPDPSTSPEFVAATGALPRAGFDFESAIAATSYGQELYEAMGTFTLPPDRSYAFFEQTPDESKLEAIPVIAPEFITRIERSRASVAALSPPEEYAVDQATILQFFDDLLANHNAVVAAAESNDIAAVRTGIDRAVTRDLYCAAAAELSDDALAAVPYFGAPGDPPPFCPS